MVSSNANRSSTEETRKGRPPAHPEKRSQLLGVDVLEWYYQTVVVHQQENMRKGGPPAKTNLGATGKGSMTLSIGYIKDSSSAWVGSLFGHEGQHYLNSGEYSGANLW